MTKGTVIRVYLLDDHEIILNGIRTNLEFEDDIQVVGSGSDYNEACRVVCGSHPAIEADVIIIDINLNHEERTGLDLLLHQNERSPAAIVYSMHHDDEMAMRAIKQGAMGYVSKGGRISEVIEAIRKVHQGKRYITPEIQEMIVNNLGNSKEAETRSISHEALSPRELQVMLMLANGLTVIEIAESLFLSSKTVETHRSKVLEKMKMRNVADIARYAVRNKLI